MKNTNQQNRVGQTQINNQGLKMTVIRYKNAMDLDVRFEDGQIVTHKRWDSFINKRIAHPDKQKYKNSRCRTDRIGETITNRWGQKLKIIKYNTIKDITVEFADHKRVEHTDYMKFKRGMIQHPDSTRIGEIRQNNQGLTMTITEYFSCKDITVKFADGSIVRHQFYSRFKEGTISHPDLTNKEVHTRRIGETIINAQGFKAEIIDYDDHTNITVQFEDKVIKPNIRYNAFKNKNVPHPNIRSIRAPGTKNPKYAGHFFKTEIHGIACITNNVYYYYCHCPICLAHEIWTTEEIKAHACNQR